MAMERAICPHCGSGDVEPMMPPRVDDVFASIPTPQRHCLVCGVRWESDEIDLGERSAG